MDLTKVSDDDAIKHKVWKPQLSSSEIRKWKMEKEIQENDRWLAGVGEHSRSLKLMARTFGKNFSTKSYAHSAKTCENWAGHSS